MELKEDSILKEIFTEKELAELDFTEEEIDAIESAEQLSQITSVLPQNEKELDKLFEKIDKTFPNDADFMTIAKIYGELMNKDPQFINQLYAISFIMDEVTPVPEPKTEKVSLNTVNQLNQTLAQDEKKAKYTAVLQAFKELAEKEGK